MAKKSADTVAVFIYGMAVMAGILAAALMYLI